jgi:nitroimidazol reductase NimA-like FMN-containing flavoprotein (pyridoxamine 5'-phosphate oxidase superfamily)
MTRTLTTLTRAECWQLLSARAVARLAWCTGGLPEIRPVNYRVIGEHLVLQSAPAGWHRRIDGAVVALEADDVDEGSRSGRTVVVRGTARVLHRDSDVLRAASAGRVSWLDGRSVGVLVTPAEVSGRWLLPPGA